ncbi:hypothetical protein HG530_015319 [Fusarium avenaceum]|nr:hypothetical protein HG530_015319 [Fusarium avenaceum]
MLLITVLDTLDPLLHPESDLAGLLALGLEQTALIGGLSEFLHGVLALADLPALRNKTLTSQVEHRFTSDTLEDGTVKRSCHKLLLASLLVLENGKHPEVLLETTAGSLELRNDAGRIVCTQLLVANTTGPSTNSVISGLERNGLEAEESGAGRANAECLLGSDHGGAQVERVSSLVGDEASVEVGELGDEVDAVLGLKGGKRNTGGRLVESRHVLVGSEESHFAILVLVGLHALEALKGVVENTCRRVEGEVLVWGDLGLQPSFVLIPFDRKHVV